MARLAKDRDTHLTREEIATEALRQFDAGESPSIRGLAAALKVAPAAVYHHFPSIAAIFDAAVDLVWDEALAAGEAALLADPTVAEPHEFLVVAGLVTRRAFLAHPVAATHLASTADSSRRLSDNLGLLVGTFALLGLSGDQADLAFHSYVSFTIGSLLLVTARVAAAGADLPADRPPHDLTALTRISVENPQRDEELFVRGLRRLVAGFTEPG